MVSGLKNEKSQGRNFALTIILGVFIAIMVSILFNLVVSYVYESPKYEDFCKINNQPYPTKLGLDVGVNCSYNQVLQEQSDKCYLERGMPVYNYDSGGCTISLKDCDMCGKNWDDAIAEYNKRTFFIFALIGFVLIVVGLYVSPLLVQIATLPSGAVLVIEAAIKNFDDKLMVIIIFALLIIAAIVLALRKLK
jgi:hypothetical protein